MDRITIFALAVTRGEGVSVCLKQWKPEIGTWEKERQQLLQTGEGNIEVAEGECNNKEVRGGVRGRWGGFADEGFVWAVQSVGSCSSVDSVSPVEMWSFIRVSLFFSEDFSLSLSYSVSSTLSLDFSKDFADTQMRNSFGNANVGIFSMIGVRLLRSSFGDQSSMIKFAFGGQFRVRWLNLGSEIRLGDYSINLSVMLKFNVGDSDQFRLWRSSFVVIMFGDYSASIWRLFGDFIWWFCSVILLRLKFSG